MNTSNTLLNDSVQDTENSEERSVRIKRVFKTAVVLLRCVHFWYDYDDHENHDTGLNETNEGVSNIEPEDNTLEALEDKAENTNYSNQNVSTEVKDLFTTDDTNLLSTQTQQFQERADNKLGSLRETSSNSSQEINDNNRPKEHNGHGNGNTQCEEIHNMDSEDNDNETQKQVPTSANRKMSTYLVQISALGGLKCH